MGSIFNPPSPPPAPDYTGAARAQGEANVETARVQGRLNNPNIIGPYYEQQVTYEGDQPTLTQTFTPQEQAIFEQDQATRLALGDVAGQGAGALQGVVGTPIDFSGQPALPPSAGDLRQNVFNAMMARVNEDTDRRNQMTHSNLIAAGHRPGTQAYDDAMALNERVRTDAANQAYLAAGAEASRDYGIQEAMRRQGITEYLATRQTPINEISALMSGSQISNPFQVPGYAQNTAIQPPPLFNATVAQGNYAADVYNAEQAQNAALMSGLFGLGGAGLGGYLYGMR